MHLPLPPSPFFDGTPFLPCVANGKIRERVNGAIDGTSPLKFILISGHDTTLLAFLSAVAPGAWNEADFPPYATLSTIELLRVGGGEGVAGDYFRFIYNGEVLRLNGCDQGERS